MIITHAYNVNIDMDMHQQQIIHVLVVQISNVGIVLIFQAYVYIV